MQKLKVYFPHIFLRKVSEDIQKTVNPIQKHSKEKFQNKSSEVDLKNKWDKLEFRVRRLGFLFRRVQLKGWMNLVKAYSSFMNNKKQEHLESPGQGRSHTSRVGRTQG